MLEEFSWSPNILGRQVFSAEKNEKAMPSVTGQVELHYVGMITPAKQDEK